MKCTNETTVNKRFLHSDEPHHLQPKTGKIAITMERLAKMKLQIASPKKWRTYTGNLYFYPRPCCKDGFPYKIHDDRLPEGVKSISGIHEKIIEAKVFRSNLFGPSLKFFFHSFVVLETESWWWSIEKNSKGVTLQRSKCSNEIIYYVRGKLRNEPITEVLSAPGQDTMMSLIELIYVFDLLKSPYDLLRGNCKHFAAKVFEISNGNRVPCRVGHHLDLPHPFHENRILISWRNPIFILMMEQPSTQGIFERRKLTMAKELLMPIPSLDETILTVCIIDVTLYNRQAVVFKTGCHNWTIAIESHKRGDFKANFVIVICQNGLSSITYGDNVLQESSGNGTVRHVFDHLCQVGAFSRNSCELVEEVCNYFQSFHKGGKRLRPKQWEVRRITKRRCRVFENQPRARR